MTGPKSILPEGNLDAADPAIGAEPTTARNSQSAASGMVLLGMLLLINIFNYLDRQLPFILAESIKQDLQLSDTQLGLLGGLSFTIVYSIFALPLARLADRWSPGLVIIGSLFIWSAMTALGGMATQFWHLVATRMGVAFGEAGSTPPAHALIANNFAPAKRSFAIAIFSLGVPMGTMLGLVAGGWLADTLGWRWTFIALGLPGVVLALLFPLVSAQAVQRSIPGHRQPYLETVRELLTSRIYCHVVAALTVNALAAYSFQAFSPAYFIRIFGETSGSVGLWMGLIYGVGGTLSMLAGGVVGDRLARRDPRWLSWLPAGAMIVAAVFVIAGLSATDARTTMALWAVSICCWSFYIPPMFASIQRNCPAGSYATATAVLALCLTLFGASVGPLVIGVVSDAMTARIGIQGLRWAFYLLPVWLVWAGIHYLYAARAVGLSSGSR